MAERRVAVVTGASSGIGEAIAARLTEAGYRVFGASRRKPGDSEHGSENGIEHIAMDVNDDESVRAGVDSVLAPAGRIDLLVNNAGYLCAGAVEEITHADAKAQFETNYFGVLRTTLAVLPAMRERRAGHVITVSSLAGLVPVPFWGHYNASKFAVEGLMETLRHEVRPFGIQVALVEPGSIKTPFYAKPHAPAMDAYTAPRANTFAKLADYERKAPGPDVVARTIAALATTARPPLRTRITKEAQQFTLLRWILPAGAFESGIRRGFRLTATPGK